MMWLNCTVSRAYHEIGCCFTIGLCRTIRSNDIEEYVLAFRLVLHRRTLLPTVKELKKVRFLELAMFNCAGYVPTEMTDATSQ
jgi:hypothetical protein